jgi:DNA-binding XRE family transcriptional regulator
LKRGYKPIRIQIISTTGDIESESESESNAPECQAANVCPPSTIQNQVKTRKLQGGDKLVAKKLRAELVLNKLEEAKRIDVSEQKLKQKEEEYGALEKANMVPQTKLDVTERKLKSAQVLSNYYKKENFCKEIYAFEKSQWSTKWEHGSNEIYVHQC